MKREDLQPYTYYNPADVPWLAIAAGVAAVGGIIYLVLRPGEAYAAAPPPPVDDLPPPPPPDDEPPPPPPPPPGEGPGGILQPEPEPEPEDPGELAPQPAPTPEPGPVDFQDGTGADVAQYPWESPVLINSYPTPSTIYRVKAGDNMSNIVRKAVASALALAGREELVVHMNPANPSAYGESWAKRLRGQMRDAMTCSWYMDTLYGQEDQQVAGGSFGMGPQGRGLNWNPVHANQIGRLAAGLSSRRTTDINGNRFANVPAADADDFMTAWIPAPNLQALKTLPKEELNLVFDVQWSTGTFAINPPPQISEANGIDDAIFDGGCPGWTQ